MAGLEAAGPPRPEGSKQEEMGMEAEQEQATGDPWDQMPGEPDDEKQLSKIHSTCFDLISSDHLTMSRMLIAVISNSSGASLGCGASAGTSHPILRLSVRSVVKPWPAK